MKKIIAITVLVGSALQFLQAQMDENIKPKSFGALYEDANVNETLLPAFNAEEAANLDLNDTKNGKLPLFSRNIPCDIRLNNKSFSWELAHNFNGLVARHKITSKNALGLVLLFDKLYLPEGATLHIYSPDKKQVLGAYTHANTPEPIPFNAGIILGESCIIEYSVPMNTQVSEPVLQITEIGHAYRWLKQLEDVTGVTDADACEVNVACTEATNWQDQKRSVARILVTASGGQGFCTGALVNNTRQDCTAYLLSAQHCSQGTSTAQFAQWVFYFNYEASACNGTTGPQNRLVTGCTKIADSNDNGGATGSDFLLLKLNSTPSAAYNVYYAGWTATGTASTDGVCIHHPDGDIKKISTYTQTLTSTEWGSSVNDTHWSARWATTANGHGVTEPGSSGGPLFNNQGLICGTLTGGGSFCSSPNSPDQFGKVSYHWAGNGTASNRRLKPWLDPDNTGALSQPGTNSPCGSNIQNDAGIQAVTAPEGPICDLTFTPTFILRNFGANTLSTVTINYQIDGNVYQYIWTGTLQAGGSLTITRPVVTLSAGNHTFYIETVSPNGVTDNNTSNDTKATNFTIIPINNALNLNLRTDGYGSETTWDIKNGSNTIVASGGPYTDVTGGETINTPVCIGPGCYTFTIYDDQGDGIDDAGNGNFQLTGSSGTPIYAVLQTAAFGSQEIHSFCIAGATGIEETNTTTIKVMPNPSSGIFNIAFGDAQTRTILVFDATGRLVTTQQSTGSNFALNLSQHSKGIYILQVESTTGRAVKKLVVE